MAVPLSALGKLKKNNEQLTTTVMVERHFVRFQLKIRFGWLNLVLPVPVS